MAETHRDVRDIDVNQLNRDIKKVLRMSELMSTDDCVNVFLTRINSFSTNVNCGMCLCLRISEKQAQRKGNHSVDYDVTAPHLPEIKKGIRDRVEYGKQETEPDQVITIMNRLKI